MSDIRWTDKIWLDSDGNLQSFEGPIHYIIKSEERNRLNKEDKEADHE